MAYVPPHLRKGNTVRSPTEAMLIPRFRKNLNSWPLGPEPNSNTNSRGKIGYADNAIWRWIPVGLNGEEMDFQSPALQLVPVEQIERTTGEEPLAVANSCLLTAQGGEVSRDDSGKPWVCIAEKVLQDLICSFDVVRSETEGECSHSEDVRLKLVARVGKVLFFPTRASIREEEPNKDSVSEASLRQIKRIFYTNVPASYVDGIVDDVVPKIGFGFEYLKDIYHVQLSDRARPEATILCKCRVVKEENRLELYKIELNQIRHMVYDISCMEKNLDLRLVLSTKRTVISLTDDEEENIMNLISAAVLDPNSKGGLRLPFRRASSCEDRYRVVRIWHTTSRVYGIPSLRLKVRDADRFDFRTSAGEVTREITIVLKGVTSELLGKKVENNSVSDMLEDTIKLLWENFLHSEHSCMV